MLRRNVPPNISRPAEKTTQPTKANVKGPPRTADDPTNDVLSNFERVAFDNLLFWCFFLIRIASAFRTIINDCDEVYNYWEPLHLFLYGEGFQTWEYSPVYAIRSYFYIFLHYIPASLLSSYLTKTGVFYGIRLMLALFCFFGESYAYFAIRDKIGERTGRYFFIFTMCSTGVYLASPAFLPSSYCMTITYLVIGAFLKEDWSFGISCVAFSTLVVWPFSALIGLPFVIHMLFLKDLKAEFILPALFSGLSIGTVQFLYDSYYFGKPVVAPLNIVLYNVLSGPGPGLYGEEPLSFYIKNLFLNWNVVFILFMIGIPVGIWKIIEHRKRGSLKDFVENNLALCLFAATTLLWMLIFGAQAHKEERFLFPIYPFIALFGALAFEWILEIVIHSTKKSWTRAFSVLFLLSYVALSASRGMSTYLNYEAHSGIYKDLRQELNPEMKFLQETSSGEVQVCVGKEWHRFPSSFFLPPNDREGRKVRLDFVKSEFRGLLPKPYKTGLHLIDATRNEPLAMNNMNKEEPSRYVKLDSCNYFIDKDMPATEFEPDLRTMPEVWKAVASRQFLDSTKPVRFGGITRSFFVPIVTPRETPRTSYTLYQNNQTLNH